MQTGHGDAGCTVPGGAGGARIVPMGERALLVEISGTAAALALYTALRADPLPCQVDVVPGARSVLVRFSENNRPEWTADLSRRYDAATGSHSGLGSGRSGASAVGDLGGMGDAGGMGALGDLGDVDGAGDRGGARDALTIDVVYHGADLDEVARMTGLGPEGVVTAHTGTAWRVAFCGFAPGFGYLAGGDPRLVVPRRQTPRTQVPAGSVGLAGEYSAVYPTASPGGWQLIGRTAAPLWDAHRDPPALLRPGMTVRFRAVREAVTGSAGPAVTTGPAVTGMAGRAATAVPQSGEPDRRVPGERQGVASAGSAGAATAAALPVLTVLRPGILCTVQDLGREGLADLGVSRSGAADRGAAARANRIVGNAAGAALLEVTLGGAEFEFGADTLVAVTGAPVPVQIGGRDDAPAAPADPAVPAAATDAAAGMDRPVAVRAGARLRFGRPERGLRSYLAVRGGIEVAPVLDSRSTDLLNGIGPTVLRCGDSLMIGEKHWGTPHAVAAPAIPEVPVLDVLPGPQLDWFESGALDGIAAAAWTVTPASNRVGARLAGPAPRRIVTRELPSQGLVRGAVQVPPSGELVIFLADHPVTGGYPVIGVLTEAAADLAAQARPGAAVRFRIAPVVERCGKCD